MINKEASLSLRPLTADSMESSQTLGKSCGSGSPGKGTWPKATSGGEPDILTRPCHTLVLNGIGIWSDYLLPLIVLGRRNVVRTIPLAVSNFAGVYAKQWDLTFVFPLLAQKYIIKGMIAVSHRIRQRTATLFGTNLALSWERKCS
jgi:hypothetical protein